jgi:hypothetical protein
MQKSALAALLSLAIYCGASAGEHAVPAGKPVATITVPDDWKTSELDSGFEATSSDGAIYLAVSETSSDSIKECIAIMAKYLMAKGVTVTEDSRKQRERKLGSMDVVDIFWDGKDEKGAMKVSLSIVAVNPTQCVLVTSWATPANEKARAQSVLEIVQSIKKA